MSCNLGNTKMAQLWGRPGLDSDWHSIVVGVYKDAGYCTEVVLRGYSVATTETMVSSPGDNWVDHLHQLSFLEAFRVKTGFLALSKPLAFLISWTKG
jgi:hypothetical protein